MQILAVCSIYGTVTHTHTFTHTLTGAVCCRHIKYPPLTDRISSVCFTLFTAILFKSLISCIIEQPCLYEPAVALCVCVLVCVCFTSWTCFPLVGVTALRDFKKRHEQNKRNNFIVITFIVSQQNNSSVRV